MFSTKLQKSFFTAIVWFCPFRATVETWWCSKEPLILPQWKHTPTHWTFNDPTRNLSSPYSCWHDSRFFHISVGWQTDEEDFSFKAPCTLQLQNNIDVLLVLFCFPPTHIFMPSVKLPDKQTMIIKDELTSHATALLLWKKLCLFCNTAIRLTQINTEQGENGWKVVYKKMILRVKRAKTSCPRDMSKVLISLDIHLQPSKK